MLKLIADSGSTKTDWTLLDGEGMVRATCHSQGLNPYHLSDDAISQVLREVKGSLPVQEEQLSIYFYGSGVTDAMVPNMERLLVEAFAKTDGGMSASPIENVEAHAASDMLGAARALLGNEAGIAVILGTGSNSCFYDGERMVQGIPPLGYVLGDEGSGTAIGKAFLRLIFRQPEATLLKDKFLEWSGMDYAAIIDRIYRQPLANRFLASISTFVGETLAHQDTPLLSEMVRQVYVDFCHQVLSFYQMEKADAMRVGFVGSIAYYFKDYIAVALQSSGFVMGRVLKSPMEGLVHYHT